METLVRSTVEHGNALQQEQKLSLELYRKLAVARYCEDAIIKYYQENEMKTPMHMSYGQEGIPVGVCAALDDNDVVYSSYRSHALYLAKTGDIEGFFGELYGRVTGRARGKAGSMHLAYPEKGHFGSSAIVASHLPLAVGSAYAFKYRNEARVACTFFGDGAVDEGVFWESLNLATVLKVPAIFVCEDNGYAVHTAKHQRYGYKDIRKVVEQFNIHLETEESNDVEKIYAAAQRAVCHAKENGEPAFIYAPCYRYLEHVGIAEDFEAGYRSQVDFERWQNNDTLKMQRALLVRQGWQDSEIEKLESSIQKRIEECITQAKAAPFPEVDEIYKGVLP